MPFHSTTGNQTLRGLGFLALVIAMAAVELYRQWKGGWAAGGTRQ
jgi:hypothetical protein